MRKKPLSHTDKLPKQPTNKKKDPCPTCSPSERLLGRAPGSLRRLLPRLSSTQHLMSRLHPRRWPLWGGGRGRVLLCHQPASSKRHPPKSSSGKRPWRSSPPQQREHRRLPPPISHCSSSSRSSNPRERSALLHLHPLGSSSSSSSLHQLWQQSLRQGQRRSTWARLCLSRAVRVDGASRRGTAVGSSIAQRSRPLVIPLRMVVLAGSRFRSLWRELHKEVSWLRRSCS